MVISKNQNLLRNFGLNTKNHNYVIAEIGINHGGSLEKAEMLIESASRTGCDAVKFQTYITEKRAPKNNKKIYNILKKCELSFKDFEYLKKFSEKRKIEFFSTPFDLESLNFLCDIGVNIVKVSSFDLTNRIFLEHISKTNRTIIISTGMGKLNEINNALDILSKNSNKIILLHCVSSYPTQEKEASLANILELKSKFKDVIIGQSDHTNDIKVPLYAVAVGARVIEKHYMINKDDDCIDATVSISENQMLDLVTEIRKLEKIIGSPIYGVTESQKNSLIFRRSS